MWARTRRTSSQAVTIPLEEAINGVEGMRYISRRAPNRRHQHHHHHLPDRLRSRYRRGGRAEPRGQRAGPPAGRGEQHRHLALPRRTPTLSWRRVSFSPDGRYSPAFISNYLDVYVTDALKRVPGVGDVIIFGERKYAMRIWLDPVKLAARGLTPPT